MLSVKKLHAGYGETEILHGIDFNTEEGEIVAIIGPNGAGKTTLLKSIFQLCNVFSGSILLENEDISSLPTAAMITRGIAYVPQERPVFPEMSVSENLRLSAFSLEDKAAAKQKIRSVLSQFPFLSRRLDDYAYSLSGGQQRLLAIAMALVHRPRLLLLDEPSLGLAPMMVREVLKKVEEINARGVSVALVEQNAKQAVHIAHRTYVLENGKIVLEGNKKALSDSRLKRIYFGGV